MARIPTTYSSGIATAGRLQATNVPLTPLDAGQEVPRALANFGQSLEKAMFNDVKLEQDAAYRESVASFRENLATTQASLLKRKEDLDNDQSIPEQDKAKRFSEYATAQQDLLFKDAPKAIQQEYKSQFINMVTPIETQVQNNAQAAQAMSMQKNVVVATDKAQMDIEAIASQDLPVDQRNKMFTEYIAEAKKQLLQGTEGLGGRNVAQLQGSVEVLEQNAVKHYQKIMLKQTQAKATAALDDAAVAIANSPSAIANPAASADSIRQMVMAYGARTGMDGNQIRDYLSKQLNNVWQNAARGKFNEADDPKASLGAKVVADRELLKALTSTTKEGVYAFGGNDYTQEARQGMIQLVQNRIERNQDKIRSEALARQSQGGNALMALANPLEQAAKAAGEKVVPITLANPAGSLKAREQQAKRLGVDVILTQTEAESIAGQFMKQTTPRAAFEWVNNLTTGLDRNTMSKTVGMISSQIKTSNPAASRALQLFAAGRKDDATAYYEGKQLFKFDGSNPPLDKKYNTAATTARTVLSGALDALTAENIVDVVATLSTTKGMSPEKVIRDVVGEVREKGKYNPFVPNSKYIVPAGYDGDRINNFFKNPDKKMAATLGTTPDIIKNAQIVYRAEGYYLKDPNTGNIISNGDGMAVVIPFNAISGVK